MERSLVDHVNRGDLLDLAAGDEEITEAAMRSWDGSRTCRASVIRDILRGRLVPDPDPHGLRLRGARVIGRIDLENLSTEVNVELTGCLLDGGLLAREARMASIALNGCHLEHPTAPPLDAAWLTCNVLDLSRATVIGHAWSGAVNLVGARIGGVLQCDGASLRNDSGPALNANGLQADQGLLLRGGFTAAATGTGAAGAVNLAGARIGGQMDCSGASLGNNSGPALNANGLQVEGGMFLAGFSATGAGDLGAVVLAGARTGGALQYAGASLGNNSGPALNANGLQVDQAMYLTGGFTATGPGDGVAVDLRRARVGGTLVYAPARLEYKVFDSARLEPTVDPQGRLAVDGLTYTGVPEQIPARDWRRLLREGTRRYAAQPYQQLAAGHRALGDERQARLTLMAQRDDQLARADTSWQERLWGKITKVTLGYGYQPWRALVFLAGVVAVSCVLAWSLGAHGALAQTGKTATPGWPCTVVQQISVGLDLNLPVGTSVARAGCDLTTDSASATAAWLTAAGWVLRLLAWVFAALFIAGFTSAVRKP